MSLSKHIVIVAGEASGDLHAASLVHALQRQNVPFTWSGIGGQALKNAGVTLIKEDLPLGITGITEVLRYAKQLRKTFIALKKHLTETKPDLLILVDYPGFNLRLATFAKKHLGLRILYYISPQLWAWKPKRIHRIKASVDHMAVIFPFEKKVYLTHNVPVSFVGHPLSEKPLTHHTIVTAREALNLPQHKKLIALLPGSRENEIARLLPIMLKGAKQLLTHHPDLGFVIPVAHTLSIINVKQHLQHHPEMCFYLIDSQAITCMVAADSVVVASGTASLEAALLQKPMCIIYKASWFTYFLATKLIRVKYLGLCNLLKNKMVVPELLQQDCSPETLSQVMHDVLFNKDTKDRMQIELSTVKHLLSIEQRDIALADLVIGLVGSNIPQ